jgi:transposase
VLRRFRFGKGRKTHRAYLWAYAPGAFEDLKAVVYDFAPSHAGEHARTFLGDWRGSLVTDDYSGYKKTFSQDGVTEMGCMAHARRKFFDLHAANQSQLAQQALNYIGELYEIEREAKTWDATQRWRLRQDHAKPIADRLHQSSTVCRLRAVFLCLFSLKINDLETLNNSICTGNFYG